jgi:hypothetical protein
MAKVLFQEWRNANLATKYPFSPRATMTNGESTIFEGFFLDAALFAVGLGSPTYLSEVVVTHSRVTFYIGDASNSKRCSGSFALASPPETIDLVDDVGRPAGKMVCEPLQLVAIQSWGIGSHVFRLAETEFCATCVFPTPERCVRAVADSSGVQAAGDVAFVGDSGIALTVEDSEDGGEAVALVRVHAVGDPYFRRRICQPTDLFATPRFIKAVRFVASNGEFTCTPDDGEIFIEFDARLAARPVIRVSNTTDGITLKTIGSKITEEDQ